MDIRPTVPTSMQWFFAVGFLIGCTSGHDSAGLGAGPVGVSTGTGGAVAIASGVAGAASGGSTDTSSGGSTGAVGVLHDYLEDPNFPDEFWQSASFASLGIDGARFEGAVDHIQRSGWEIHSLLVAYKGKLVFERYGLNTGKNPNSVGVLPHQTLPSERQSLFSTTKSFTSTLVGIAIDESLIPNVSVKVATYFPDYEALSPSAAKSSITIEDLLTMRSGLEFTEGEDALFQQSDPARALLSRPVVWDVGVDWNYNSGNTQILMEILRVATGQSPLEYASTRLFEPLGILDIDWQTAPNGSLLGGFGLSLTGREMARFGELFRKSGVWANQQVVSKSWVDTATAAHCDSDWGRPYGYLWFVPRLGDFFNTVGARGQEIFVSRERELVVVFTGNLPDDSADMNYTAIIREFVLPALPD